MRQFRHFLAVVVAICSAIEVTSDIKPPYDPLEVLKINKNHNTRSPRPKLNNNELKVTNTQIPGKVKTRSVTQGTRNARSVEKSECKHGYYGEMCEKTCNSRCEDGCHKESGNCRQCPPGFYGPKCLQSCPTNCGESYYSLIYCDVQTGECLDGCRKGFWGSHCENSCYKCKNSDCLYTDGQCLNGCEDGYHGDKCLTRCPMNCKTNECSSFGVCENGCMFGYYGDLCSTKCTSLCAGGACNQQGECTNGCNFGYIGKHCNNTCPKNCIYCSEDGSTCFTCKSGFQGSTCDVQSFEHTYHVVLIMCLLLLVLLISLVFAFSIWICYALRKRSKSHKCILDGLTGRCNEYRNLLPVQETTV